MSFSTITLRPTTAKTSPPHSRPAPPYYGCAAAIPTACWWQPSSSRKPAGAMCTSTAARPYPRSAPAEPQICLKSPAMPSPLSDRGSGGKLATQHQAEAEQRRTPATARRGVDLHRSADTASAIRTEIRAPSARDRMRLTGGGREIRTCMGLFLSSRHFWFLPVLCSERESRSSSRRLRSGSRRARKGSRDRNGSKAWRVAA